MRKISFSAILALLCVSAGFGQNLTIQTLAGGGAPPNIQATSASLGLVSGAAVFGGSVYMTLQTYSAVVKMDASGNLTLVAGNGTPGFSGDNGPATGAQLNNPWGIAFDISGNLYIADSGNNCIREVSASTGKITTLGTGSVSLSDPLAVAVDASLNVYIADTGNNVVRKWSNGVTTTVAGTGASGYNGPASGSAAATAVELSSPAGVAVDTSGNLYISDYNNGLIRKVVNSSLTSLVQVSGPVGLALDSASNLYIASYSGGYIGKLPASGTGGAIVAGTGAVGYTGDSGAALGATLDGPAAVALDPSGNVYIADYYNHVLRKFAVGGVINTVAGSIQGYDGDGGPATSALLFAPTSTATGPAGELYIADQSHNSVRKVLNGTITTVAGTGAPGYSGDGGLATSAQLSSPWGVAVDSGGNLYISDTANHVIREVSGGVISTVAGVGGVRGYNNDNISATTANLNFPSGITLDTAGNLYIADYGNNRIRKVTNGTITTVVGNGTGGYNGDGIAPTGTAPAGAELFNPIDVKLDAAGNLYIADLSNNLVRVVVGGVIQTIAGLASNTAAGGPGGYGGDGGPSSSALLNGPSGIALDAAGALYIADTSNNVLRKVSGGVINTIAGNGAAAFSGDLGPPTSASLNVPSGVSIDKTGQIYIADTGNNVIRTMNQVCNPPTVTPTFVQATAAGGPFSISVNIQTFCSWTVSGLPTWIATGGALSNTGPGRFNFVIAPDAGAARSATILVAGVSVTINQAACTYAISPGTQIFPAAGGGGTVTITTASVCAWSATNTNPWITFSGTPSGTGIGTLNFTVASSASGRTGTFTIAGLTFTVDEQASSIPGLTLIGSMPHLAAEENWVTTFTLVNTTLAPNQVRLNLFGSDIDASGDGSPLQLPLSLPQQPGAGLVLGASYDSMLAPSATLAVSTGGQGILPVLTGSAQVLATGALGGYAIFHRTSDAQEAVVPITPATPNAPSYTLAFDNTNGIATAVAVANVSSQTTNNIRVTIRDDTGNQIFGGALSTLPGNGQTSFTLPTDPVYGPITANKRGTIEFDTPSGGQISVLGIRFTQQGATQTLTTVPALANVGTGGGSIAHLASGGDGWQTTFVLVNVGNSTTPATLSFFDDGGNPLPLPYSFPQQAGSTVTTAPSITQSLAAGATLLVQSNGAPTLLTGSAQLTTKGTVSGFVIFRHSGQEAVVPLESSNASASAYVLAFDNTASGAATGVAINDVSSSTQTVNIPVVVRDDMGNQLTTDTLNVAPNGHYAFTLGSDRYPQTATIRGTIEFGVPAAVQIGALGIRIQQTQTTTYTSLPAIAK